MDELQFVANHLNVIARKYKIKISQEINVGVQQGKTIQVLMKL